MNAHSKRIDHVTDIFFIAYASSEQMLGADWLISSTLTYEKSHVNKNFRDVITVKNCSTDRRKNLENSLRK